MLVALAAVLNRPIRVMRQLYEEDDPLTLGNVTGVIPYTYSPPGGRGDGNSTNMADVPLRGQPL